LLGILKQYFTKYKVLLNYSKIVVTLP